MKEDNVSQLGDYGTHSVSSYISLFKFKSFDQFNTPQTASNFRHLLSCGTIVKTVRAEGHAIHFTFTEADIRAFEKRIKV